MFQFLPFEAIVSLSRLALAQAIVIVFFLLNVVNFSIPHAGDFKPFFLLMVVYYWTIYRPTLLPVFYTFVLGLAFDFLANLPVGLSALILVTFQTIILRSRIFLTGQPFMMVWLGFGVISLVNAFGFWGIMSLAHFSSMPVAALLQILMAAFFSILLFPVATLVLRAVHGILPVASKPVHSVG